MKLIIALVFILAFTEGYVKRKSTLGAARKSWKAAIRGVPLRRSHTPQIEASARPSKKQNWPELCLSLKWRQALAVGLSGLCTLFTSYSPAFADDNVALTAIQRQSSTASAPNPLIASKYRLLEEAWRVVRDNYIDPTYNHHDWNEVHDQYVKKLESSPFVSEVEQTKKMLALLGDKYTRLLSPSVYATMYKYDAIGVGILFTSDEGGGNLRIASPPLKGSEAAALGLKKGDLIVSIQGEGTEKLTALDVLDRLSTDPRSTITLRIRSPSEEGSATVTEREVVLTRKTPSPSATTEVVQLKYYPVRSTTSTTSAEEVAVITLREFSSAAIPALTDVLKEVGEKGRNVKHVVLDLRGNTGGGFQFALNIGGMFLGEGVEMVSVKSRSQGGVGSLERGVFYTPSTPDSTFYTRPIVIMMDELTASASEVLAAGLRDNCHAVLAGSRSFGKGVIQGVYGLEGGKGAEGYGMTVTVGEYLTPRGDSIQGRGLLPGQPVSVPPAAVHLLASFTPAASSTDFDVSAIDWEAVDALPRQCKVDYAGEQKM